ncbi:MAG: hypothetical protein ABSF60_11555 [Verrucomicrobiota bacterium]
MNFVKKHYEKILLSVVLLGLMGVLVFMLYLIPSDRQRLATIRQSIISHAVKPLDVLDLSRETNVSARLQSPYKLDFSTTNKLFNPVQWQRAADGSLIKIKTGNEIGPKAVGITKITPLYLILTLDAVETNEFGARYVVSVERQAAYSPAQRGKRQHYASVGEKNETFTVIDVNGSPANPAQTKLILQLTDTGERATLSKDKPFRRVDGYSADLKYDPEGKKWQGQRVGADLRFAGDDNIIVAIEQDTVILLARSNQKKTALTYNPIP